ncbi:MAG: class I SAM-dependent methyltransferase [Rhodobiaceae bacterium]|nr:class I SAM-dependent methyltransferase [Rhodobiaceae bacterium]MCC0018198.1 class I SAM-dependent methyltransferase [Rhodobiaceae bacterium]MCC0041686.1 class I SAM-dependent methyltransferase [Rhodobiaceae bacterium]
MYEDLKGVSGWLGYTDYVLVKELLEFQGSEGLAGGVVEIGVHHGKSFVPLATYSGADPCYAIDVFGDQGANVDRSGHGDRERFVATLKRFGVDLGRLTIDQRRSADVSADDIVSRVGRVRFFHIDGGHHVDAVTGDIALALETVAEHGIIAIDDVFRPEWPEVSIGVFRSAALAASDFVPFAIGFNKTYLCAAGHAAAYREALQRSEFLRAVKWRVYEVEGSPIDVYQRYPLPEWDMWTLLAWVLETYFPRTFLAVSRRRTPRFLGRLIPR